MGKTRVWVDGDGNYDNEGTRESGYYIPEYQFDEMRHERDALSPDAARWRFCARTGIVPRRIPEGWALAMFHGTQLNDHYLTLLNHREAPWESAEDAIDAIRAAIEGRG